VKAARAVAKFEEESRRGLAVNLRRFGARRHPGLKWSSSICRTHTIPSDFCLATIRMAVARKPQANRRISCEFWLRKKEHTCGWFLIPSSQSGLARASFAMNRCTREKGGANQQLIGSCFRRHSHYTHSIPYLDLATFAAAINVYFM
jgi:hypothetical protein